MCLSLLQCNVALYRRRGAKLCKKILPLKSPLKIAYWNKAPASHCCYANRAVQAASSSVLMTTSPNDFREHALKCIEVADAADDPELKQSMYDQARAWIRAAIEIERSAIAELKS